MQKRVKNILKQKKLNITVRCAFIFCFFEKPKSIIEKQNKHIREKGAQRQIITKLNSAKQERKKTLNWPSSTTEYSRLTG